MLLLESRQTRVRICPWFEPLPNAVPVDLFLFAQSLYPEFFEQLIENHSMEVVNLRPGKLALTDFAHCRAISLSPAIGEAGPIDLELPCLAPDGALLNDGT